MKIVIIEDLKITAKDLKRTILSIDSDIDVLAMLHSVEESVDYFKTNPEVDLIFSDIRLGDGLSFDIFKKINNPIPIIFCTAYNTYFAEAFQVIGIDYILKPFTKNSIETALVKYQNLENKFSKKKEDYSNLLNVLEEKLYPKKTSVIVYHRDKIIPIDSTNVALLFIENGCTYAQTFKDEKFIITDNLEDLEKYFTPQFFRANRQFLVNRKAIKDASHFLNRRIVINLNIPFKEQILVGKLKITAFIDWLSQN
jgi:two-component system, LytTR family, response regulator LytT